ncbi:MAG: hypothetical protein GY875_03420 [Gammaproteobacteria bacterium]|nr:hypothetical protein [Gammaproteobacteria bacterium]
MTTNKRTKNCRLAPIFIFLTVFGLSACGGGGGGGSDDEEPATTATTTTPTTSSKTINGGGVKGPLALAIVTVYAYDPTQPGFKGAVIARATTNAAAKIVGLSLPEPLNPPYILEFTSDANTIDITTGQAPVITTMRTVLTQTLINSGEPIYGSPLTTMAVDIAIANSNAATTPAQFEAALTTAAAQVVSTLGFGMPGDIDIFNTPPLVNETTDTTAKQAEVAAYRTAVEALTAVVFQMQQQSSGDVDEVLGELSMDLVDGDIDGMVDGSPSTLFSDTTLDVLAQDPATLPIPNAGGQTVADVQAILVAETATSIRTKMSQ